MRSSSSDQDDHSRRRSRRQFLKIAGVSALGAGFAISAGGPIIRDLTSDLPARVPPGRGGALRIDHVTVVDPRDGSRLDDGSILIRDGRIVAVGAAGTMPELEGVTVRSLSGG